LRLANWAAEAGHDVSIHSTTTDPVRLDARWDIVAKATRRLRFTEWVKQQTTVIWTHAPITEQIIWAKKRGVRTGILCLWDEIRQEHIAAYHAADFVLSPSRLVGEFVQKVLKVRNSIGLPWDTGEPFMRKDPRLTSDRIWVLMPLFDHEPYQIEATAVEVAGRALLANPRMVLTVAYNASKIAPFAVNRLKQFRSYFGERVRILPGVPLHRRPLLYASHDLTYWPACGGNIGLTGLTSVTMGTPVLSFKVPVFSEFLCSTNSIQAPATSYGTSRGLPRTEPDYDAMDSLLQAAVADTNGLHAIQQEVPSGLAQRRKVFCTVLTQAIK
jgi:hypothetical protein